MKKIISLILSVTLIIVTLTACSLTKPSFTKIEAELSIKDCADQHMCLKDNLLFVTSEKVYYDYDNNENEYEAAIEKAETRFALYDLEKDEIVCQKNEETKEPLGIFDVSFDSDDKIIVMQDEKKIYYDYNLNKLETKKYNYETDNTMALGKSDFGDDIICTTQGVYQEYSENFEALIFKTEPNSAYILDKNTKSEYVICGGKRLITQESTFNDDRSIIHSTTIKVLDFDAKQILNSYTFEYDSNNKISNVSVSGAMDNDKAVLAVCTDASVGGGESTESNIEYYKWNYNENSEPTDFKVEKCDYKALNDKAEKLTEDIGKKNDIHINLNVDTVPNYFNDYSPEDKFYIDFKIKNVIALYDSLIKVDKILSDFPKGMVSRLNDFNLYIVNSITGCGAYANTYIDDSTDKIVYYVVSSYSAVNDLPHELMHCFDNYIENNSDDNPLYEPYMALNIVNIFDESFYNDHEEEDKVNYVYNGDNKDTAEFVTEYATTSILEDKAELFQMLYNLGTDYETYKADGMDKLSAPVIRKKAELICNVLKEFFPEIKETPIWETALNK